MLCPQPYLSLPALKKSLAQPFQQSAPFYWAPYNNKNAQAGLGVILPRTRLS
ncbi:Hypothetical protein B839_01560 [Vibrio cholerae O1 str. Inaba G4222]|uniref:Uncharacterized protein n=1 Tax=Proteus mirabilis TaxID=584 RepID=A0A1Y9T5E9_PROMI|nr:hypothetical protein [Proteus mirabilis]EAZ78289.1 hypothetical protein A5E_B0060 [Vibrio cholerae B33]EMB03676.1 Hypothetical protein B839_01560 [Vibrio cholerae O1 str. Inaba G4222]